MKTTISETIDGSMKDIIQLKTLDSSLEYSQLFDALEDCPNDFKAKLIGALNSLSQTMGVSAEETFNKVLCASDDENAKKKLYNWWTAVFEVVSKSVPNIPEDRRQEYEDKLDALISEICRAGDKASGNDVVLEDYEPADVEDEDKLKEEMTFAASKIGEIAKKVEELVNFLNPYCVSSESKEVDNTMKNLNERGGSDWVSMDDMIGMQIGESDEEPINWDDEDTYNDGGFERGMWVIWTDPDGGDESVWKILKMPESEDDLFVLGQKDGSINEVYGWEIRPRDADVDEAPDMYSDDEETFKDVYRESDEEEKIVIANAKKTAKKDGYDQYILFDKSDNSWAFERKHIQTKDDYAKFGQEVVGIVRSDDLKFVPFALETVMEEDMENELKKGDDGWKVIGQPIGESQKTLDVELMQESWYPEHGIGEVVSWKDENNEMQDGWKVIGCDVNTFEYHLEKDGKDVWVDDIRVDEYNESKRVDEASVVVDANDVWDVLDLLDNDIANTELTKLINSHVRTEDEIMDAINELSGNTITKKELNTLISGRMVTIVDYLGLDAEKYEDTGEFVDPEKPVALESDDDLLKVGDKVKVVGKGLASKGWVGEISSVDKAKKGLPYTVTFADRDPGEYARNEVELVQEKDETPPDEVKDGEKKYKQDGETKTLVTGEDDNKSVVSEMTIEQEINDPWKLLNLLWGQGKDNFDELLRSNLFSDDRIMDTLEQFEVRDLTNLNDLLAYDFEQVLEALGCDVEAWTQHLEIQRA